MNYVIVNMQDFNIQQYLKDNPNTYIMLVSGSCNIQQRKGSFQTALIYNNQAMVYEGIVNDTSSANYCMLQGIRQTISRMLYKNTKICVITATALGFNRAQKGKGANLDVVKDILETVAQNDNELEIIELKCGGDYIKKRINELQQYVVTKRLNE